ncbi:hypothetical protein Bbelb_000090 [Branchiostoma belcheri]|nr:hypothetical protein Bbelb_000090 [Branchiostoma belcheri]
MATTKKSPYLVQEHAKGEDIDVNEVSSGNETDRKEEDVDAPEMCPGRRTPVPGEYSPATTRGKNTQHVKEEVPSISEKGIGGDIKKRSDHAYDFHDTGTAPNIYPNPQPAAAEPRCLHVGDLHAAVYSEQESEDTYGYREAEEVNKEESGSHNYDKPDDDVYGYEEPMEVRKAFEEEPYSHGYEKPEDVSGGYKESEDVHTHNGFEEEPSSRDYDKEEEVSGSDNPKEVSFAYRAKASVVISVILATHITHGGRMALDSKLSENGTMTLDMLNESGNSWQVTSYMDNNSAFGEFIVDNTAPTLPVTKSSVTFEALSSSVTSLSTTELNECTNKPCLHGGCVNQDGGHKCTCSPGWTGQNCQRDLNECTKKPCLHGRCVNQDGGYKCTCSPGWTGQNCQRDIDECNNNPCQHGRCVNQDGGYKCTCSSGWTGQDCQHDVDECAKNLCQHGTCVNQDGEYQCTCSPGWTGRNCQKDVDECARNLCQHGTCVNQDGGYKCTCSPGWTGQNCRQDVGASKDGLDRTVGKVSFVVTVVFILANLTPFDIYKQHTAV